MAELELGCRVCIPSRINVGEGTVRFVGGIDGKSGTFVGIELDAPSGRNNGSVKGKRYFECAEKHGVFVPIHLAERIELTGTKEEGITEAASETGGSEEGDQAEEEEPTAAGEPAVEEEEEVEGISNAEGSEDGAAEGEEAKPKVEGDAESGTSADGNENGTGGSVEEPALTAPGEEGHAPQSVIAAEGEAATDGEAAATDGEAAADGGAARDGEAAADGEAGARAASEAGEAQGGAAGSANEGKEVAGEEKEEEEEEGETSASARQSMAEEIDQGQGEETGDAKGDTGGGGDDEEEDAAEVEQEAEKSVNAVEDGLMDETEMEAFESTGLTGGSAGESLQHSGVFEQVVLDDGDDAHNGGADRGDIATPSGEELPVSAGEMMALEVGTLMNHDDTAAMIELQHDIYARVQESSQALKTFNDFSVKTYQSLGPEFERHTKMLITMRKDLTTIFKRIKNLKEQLAQQAAQNQHL